MRLAARAARVAEGRPPSAPLHTQCEICMAPINIIDESDDAEDCDAQEEKDDMTWCNHFCATGRPAVHRIAARCPLPVRFSSMLLYVVVVHVARLYVVVIVYEYRLSSHYRRVRAAHGGGCASHSRARA